MAASTLPSMNCLVRSLQRTRIASSMCQAISPARRLINTTTPAIERDTLPDSMLSTPLPSSQAPSQHTPGSPLAVPRPQSHSARYSPTRAPSPPPTTTPSPTPSSLTEPGPSTSILPSIPLDLSPSLRENLIQLTSQPPFYITIHIHGKPYLVTAGDTIRLPFLMHGVMPGDVLRLNRATLIGSRDWTLKAGANSLTPTPTDATADLTTTAPITGNTDGLTPKQTGEQAYGTGAGVSTEQKTANRSNKAPSYLDERLYVCRAVVMGTESEPMRIKEKTKRRQRHTRTVKSKHRYTILKVREVEVARGEL